MALTVKQLQEQRAPIGAEIRKMADTLGEAKPDFTAEERSKWDKINAEFNGLTRQIEIVRQAEDADAAVKGEGRSRPVPGLEDSDPQRRKKKSDREDTAERRDEVRALAFQGWCRRQHGFDLSNDHKRACKATGLNPNRKILEIRLARRPGVESRAMSAQNPALGASTVPEGFMKNFEKALKDYNGVRQVADVIRTADGATMPWPTTNDTSNEGELIGENTAVAEQDVATGSVNFNSYKHSSKMVKFPFELLEDSAFDLANEVGVMLGERIGRVGERYNTTGTGSSQPQGIVTAATLGKTAASATAIAADEIIDLIHSVDPAYRRDPSFGLMMHDLILAIIRKLKDGQGRYLFEEGQGGAPDRVKGAKIVINQNMDSTVASGKKTILAGAYRKMKIRDVGVLRMKRLEERYAELDQVAFIGFLRSDSKLLDAGTNPVKYLGH